MRNNYAINVGVMFPPWDDPYLKIKQIKPFKRESVLNIYLKNIIYYRWVYQFFSISEGNIVLPNKSDEIPVLIDIALPKVKIYRL